MADKVQVDPQQLRSAAEVTADLATKVRKVGSDLRTALAGIESDGGNRPWGNDKTGKKFADGDKGYKKARDNLLSGTDGMGETLEQFANGQRTAANFLGTTDSGSAQPFH
ncbi:hypothetical protein ACWDSJ_03880 [Nocardia sp. NPDC003482]